MKGCVYREIVTDDGALLLARFFHPNRAPRGAVLIAPAMGVGQGYYHPLADWLAGEGYVVATFDYRGIGLSRHQPLRGYDADLLDWAERDCGAVLDALERAAPGVPLYWVGHSLGGQILPFVPGHERLARAVTIASGSGYWRENAPPLRRRVAWFWFVIVPLAMRLFGYFPGRRIGLIGDIPHRVMTRWRRWCLDPDYAAGAEGPAVRQQYAAVATPIVSLSFADDEFLSARNIEALHAQYAGAPRTMKRVAPGEAGVRRIGHFGFFRRSAEALWRRLLLPELRTA